MGLEIIRIADRWALKNADMVKGGFESTKKIFTPFMDSPRELKTDESRNKIWYCRGVVRMWVKEGQCGF